MQAVYTSVFLAILCTSGVIGLKSLKPKDRNSKAKEHLSFFAGTQCGISKSAPNSARIVGGEEATPHSWPWMVFISCDYFNVAEKETYEQRCGGSIISKDWVVTAAHCLGPPVTNIIRDCQLAFGKHDIQQIEPTQVMNNRIAQYFIHPQYNQTGMGYNYDLALLKLKKPLKFNHAIQPICLPFGLGELPYNKSCYTTGWGYTAYGSHEEPGKLRQLSMMVADMQFCEKPPGGIICAVTWDDNKDVCDGDSGGPLACQEHDGNWYLRGVVSHAQENCKFWAVFTKVAEYENWIDHTIKSKKGN